VGDGADARLAAPESEVLSLIFDSHRIGSVASTLKALKRVAGTARDRISTDMWRVLHGLALKPPTAQDAEFWGAEDQLATPDTDRRMPLSDVLDLLDRTVSTLSAFGGLAMESMTRGQGWRFLAMGRRLERALNTIALLRSALVAVGSMEGPLLEALLEVADSSMTYRRRYLGSLQTAPVLDLLLADESNPRSLAFQLAALSHEVDDLPR